MSKHDVLIVGGGIAGLAVAERVKTDKNVLMLMKNTLNESNSVLAQGGIAVVMSDEDSWEAHFQDTMMAGCGINDEKAVEILVKKGPVYVKEWIKKGFLFDQNREGDALLAKEGAHQRRRILHAGGDQTGLFLTSFMQQQVKEDIEIIESEMVLDLLVENNKCIGVVSKKQNGKVRLRYADAVVLAMGGMGAMYQTTSNNEHISGDGLAMAYRIGCEMRDLEFIQFHPTMLFVKGENKGLISEAVRGEGAVLITTNGERIMENCHELKDLAPRDVVARTIFSYQQKGEDIYLDISMIEHFKDKFPLISTLCKENNIAIEDGRIPVAPGAHFHMGGIKTNLKGETSIQNLYAVGEVACLGVHGANRLASNSLLEGLVFGSLLGEALAKEKKVILNVPLSHSSLRSSSVNLKLPSKEEIGCIMNEKVGIVRQRQSLEEAKLWFESYGVHQLKIQGHMLSREQLDIWNRLTVGWLIATAALERKESIGAHHLLSL